MWVVGSAATTYSFVVLASLNRDIRRTGGLEHTTDIFPSLNIPVVSVV